MRSLCKENIVLKHNKLNIWLPILQLKVKKGTYKISKSTTPSHKPLKGEPEYLEYIIGYNNEVKTN